MVPADKAVPGLLTESEQSTVAAKSPEDQPPVLTNQCCPSPGKAMGGAATTTTTSSSSSSWSSVFKKPSSSSSGQAQSQPLLQAGETSLCGGPTVQYHFPTHDLIALCATRLVTLAAGASEPARQQEAGPECRTVASEPVSVVPSVPVPKKGGSLMPPSSTGFGAKLNPGAKEFVPSWGR